MTDPLTPERLAELRRIASYEENCNPNPEDLGVLIGEIDRLRVTVLAARRWPPAETELRQWRELNADRDRLAAELAEMTLCRDNAVRVAEREDIQIEFHLDEALADGLAGTAEWSDTAEPDHAPRWLIDAVVRVVRPELARLTAKLADSQQERADTARQLAMQRGQTTRAEALLDTITAERNDARAVAGRLLADIELWVGFSAIRTLDLAVLPSWCLDWAHAVGPHRAPQPPAEPSAAGFAGTETTESASEPQWPAESLPPPPFPVLGIIIGDEIFRTGVLPGSIEDVAALAQAPDLSGPLEDLSQAALRELRRISGFDAPIDWASVAAQPLPAPCPRCGGGGNEANGANCAECGGSCWATTPARPPTRAQDGPTAPHGPEPAVGDEDVTQGPQEPAQAVVWRTPEQWEAHYDVEIKDPDGWRPPNAQAWDQPITLAEFWRRSRSSTIRDFASDGWKRVADDARTDTESRPE